MTPHGYRISWLPGGLSPGRPLGQGQGFSGPGPHWGRKTDTMPLGTHYKGPFPSPSHILSISAPLDTPAAQYIDTNFRDSPSYFGTFSSSTDRGGPEMPETAEPRHPTAWPESL